ncbi:MAG: hypothetical protein GVY36_04505 [Verrucomicrobia bacterium]|jgi:predicted outer membrane repeat protein|nr:hypothetical protein [Verrucomicrobiota bacterium]
MNYGLSKRALAIALLFAFSLTVAYSDILRVRSGALPSGDGSTWSSPLASLQDALAAASSGDEIWVAAGTYTPDLGAGEVAGDTSSMFSLKEGVAIYGGFPTAGSGFSGRDPVANPTILSADLGGVVLAGPVIEARLVDNTATLEGFIIRDAEASAVRIVRASPVFRDCIFRDNSNLGQGGALSATDQSNPEFYDCQFLDNSASSVGGAVILGDSGGTFQDCLFEGNHSDSDGGALYANNFFNIKTTFTRCEFMTNKSDRQGGAYATVRGTQEFNDCRFESNSATTSGYVVFSQTSTTNFFDCAFIEGDLDPNLLELSSEALRFRGGQSTIERTSFMNFTSVGVTVEAFPHNGVAPELTITDSSFDVNRVAISISGDLSGVLGELKIQTTTFTGHTGDANTYVVRASDMNVEITDSDFSNNVPRGLNVFLSTISPATSTTTVAGTRFEGNGEAIVNRSSEFNVSDCQFIANSGGGIRINDTPITTVHDSEFTNTTGFAALSSGNDGALSVERCRFSDNSDRGISFRGDSLEVKDTSFRGNTSGSFTGGAVQLSASETATARFLNCLFSGNQSDNNGSAVFVNLGQTDFINCTISGNAAGQEGTIYISSGDVRFKNTLIHLNISGFPDDSMDRPDSSFFTRFGYDGALVFESSMVDNYTKSELDALSATFDNFDSFDPRFVSELNPSLAPSTGGDFRLSNSSPAFNVGSNFAYTSADDAAEPVDLAGEPRIIDDIIDLGAYELSPDPFRLDPDFDGRPNGLELALGTDPNVYDLNDPRRFKQQTNSPGTFVFGYDSATAATIILELKRSTDLVNFDVVVASSETGFPPPDGSGLITIADPNPPAGKAFYRLEAREK